MIFFTVGTELPFDRLVRAVDSWCSHNPTVTVFGQIGDPGARGYCPQHFSWKSFISPDEYQCRFSEAELVIGHAGTGSIIAALMHAKPILIMPRKSALREHRNDHQISTAKHFAHRPGVFVADDEVAVTQLLNQWTNLRARLIMEKAGIFADNHLIKTIRNFIFEKQ